MVNLLALAFILLLFGHLSLRDRVKKLEEGEPTVKSQPHPVSPLPLPDRSAEAFTVETIARHNPAFPSSSEVVNAPVLVKPRPLPLIGWFKDHALIKIGGILFFLGMAWFVSYAISEGWIAPSVRVLLGFALAIAIYTFAHLWSRVSVVYYIILTALATATLTVTALSGAAVFHLYPETIALCIVAGGVAYTVFVSMNTATEWLTILATIAGLLSPLFTNLHETPLFLLSYLLVLTGGLLSVGLKRVWRTLSLVLLFGVLWYEYSLLGSLSSLTMWFFVCVFTLLFFGSVTLAIIATREPKRLDVITLMGASAAYIGFASVLVENSGLAVFVATFIVAGVGYLLYVRGLSARVIAVYLMLASIGVTIGTSLIFSGYSLVLAYAALCLGAFLLATHLGLPERFVSVIALVYSLPLLLSLSLLQSPSWQVSVFSPDACAVYAVFVMFVSSALWLIHRPGVAFYPSSRLLAAIFGVVGFFYGYAIITVVTQALFFWPESYVMMYLLYALLSLSVLFYAMKTSLPSQVVRVVAVSLFIPLTLSANSLLSSEWQSGIYHFSAFGVWSMIGLMCLSILLLTQQYCKEYDLSLRSLNGVFILTTTLFTLAVLRVTWDSLLAPVLADVATYTSYALIMYLLISIFILVRSPALWLKVALMGFLFPVFLALHSVDLSGWSTEEFSVHLTGLFAITTFTALLSLGIAKRLFVAGDEATRATLRQMSLLYGAIAFCLSMLSVWCVAHSLVDPTRAISASLFVYTIVGLCAYLAGVRRHHRNIRYAGVVLLTVVIIRLLLIDIWQMEMVWRFITLLGIGGLFIVAAFLERKNER